MFTVRVTVGLPSGLIHQTILIFGTLYILTRVYRRVTGLLTHRSRCDTWNVVSCELMAVNTMNLTAHIFTLLLGAETILISHTSTIDELLALSSRCIVAPRGKGPTTWTCLYGLQALPEGRTVIWLHTSVTQLHRTRWTLAAL